MPFKLQYASNLFVDFTTTAFSKMAKPAAPHLALLGNIGRPESPKTYNFLRYCAKHWDNVYWIPGPHELSNPKGGRMTLSEKTMNANALTKQVEGVTLMNSMEAVFHQQRIVLLGTSLWTKVILPPKGEPEFDSIFTSVDESGPIPLTHTFRNQLHKQDTSFLNERSLFWHIVHPDVNLVYLTHTLPTSRLYTSETSDQAWKRMGMDCLTPFVEPSLRVWLGGACASTSSTRLGMKPDKQIYCGVNGLYEYPFTGNQNSKYDNQCVVEITPTKPSRLSPQFLPNLTLPPFVSSLLPKKVSLGHA